MMVDDISITYKNIRMHRLTIYIIILAMSVGCKSKARLSKAEFKELTTSFEQDNNQTATYEEAISFYQKLANTTEYVNISEVGETDCGKPLHEVVISKDGASTPSKARSQNKAVLFINNGIHPGEPCGIDASMMLARNLCRDKDMNTFLDNTTLVIIPVYNIGGSLNRGSSSRANQNGPQEYGFRGNAKNLDLNRDFIKGDSYNSRTYQKLYTKWSPDIFIDNHTSNGADYQYVLTLIATQKDKLNPILAKYMTESMLPELYAAMSRDQYEMTPYVYSRGTPDGGIYGFMDYPRYSSGYATLHNSISFISEAHMLKSYKDRVMSIYHFMQNMLRHIQANKDRLLEIRAAAIQNTIEGNTFAIDWELDSDSHSTIKFKGYESGYKASEVTGGPRLYYDRSKPYEKDILYYNDFNVAKSVQKPTAYIIPQAYRDIVDRMKINGVEVETLKKDETYNVEQYYIDDYTTSKTPYEGHYLHSKVMVTTVNRPWKYMQGDYIIKTNQKMNRYIVETLEPQAPDSWFAWNFFDGILMQKEYYSDYVFEDTAANLLKSDQDLKTKFEQKKKDDKTFAGDARAQLDFIYKNSPYYEPTYKLYPVARVLKF